MKALKKAYSILTKVEIYGCSLAFLFVVVAIVVDVLQRKFTGASLPWLEEICRVVFIVTTAIAASVAVTSDDHPRMNAIIVAVGVKRGNYMLLLTDLVCLGFFLFMTPYAIQQTLNMFKFGTGFTHIPLKMWHVYLFFALAFIGIDLRFLARSIIGVQKIRAGQDIERGEEE